MSKPTCAEARRLQAEARREVNWKRWGTYLPERQWGTVREDYSVDGSCWDHFPHDHARSRAYRWGEDGLLGVCDRECRLCFAPALWNGCDPILKERLYGLTNPQGNHGEDVKEAYHYLDATPTHSYCRATYKYPLRPFPYQELLETNRNRGADEPEYELADTGVFDGGWWDVTVEYAKAGPNDLLIRLTAANRSGAAAELHLLPTLWFRNGWSWGCAHEGCFAKPALRQSGGRQVAAEHESLGRFLLDFADEPGELLFCDNETNTALLYGAAGPAHPKDAFHRRVCAGEEGAANPDHVGTKAAGWFRREIGPNESWELRLRLAHEAERPADVFADFGRIFDDRRREADEFYAEVLPDDLPDDRRRIARQAYAGLLWTKQFYFYAVDPWIEGDPAMPPPPPGRKRRARNRDWRQTLFNRDVLSVPDKWEYPWYAAWDLAFHMPPMARLDPAFAKSQLVLLLREWYMHPNGQIPAYEFDFSDVNPPVHAWAVWRVYKMTGPRGGRDRTFLARCFQKLLLNFTWWVNRKDQDDNHLFGGGFLGLDNIGVFDRNQPIPDGRELEQADGTAWMAFFCAIMLSISLELAAEDPAYEDVASKFFEHFVQITHALNTLGGSGLWDERDGFYYDQLWDPSSKTKQPLRLRSFVGLVPTFACEVIGGHTLDRLPGFAKRMSWFREHRPELDRHLRETGEGEGRKLLLSAVPCDRLERLLGYALGEAEFLSPFGVRSLSARYGEEPFCFDDGGETRRVAYAPGVGRSDLFGGNSNWRGPIWFPLNFLFVEALERYHHFYGDRLTVPCPTAGGERRLDLLDASREVQRRLVSLFEPDAAGRRPCHGDENRYAGAWGDDLLFHEFFHAETGQGLGAAHQTGWTALVAQCIENLSPARGPDLLGARLNPRHG